MSDEVTGTLAPETSFEDTPDTGTNAEASDDDLAISELETEAEPDATDTPKDEPHPPRKLKVKIDGQELEVDEEEAAKGYQRQQDYSRNMQRLQAEQAQAQQLRDVYQQRIDAFIPDQEARLNRLAQELNVLAVEDPAAWVAKKQEFDTELMRYQHAQSEKGRLDSERQANKQQQMQQLFQRSQAAVLDAIPEWKDSAVRAKEVTDVARVIRGEVERFFGPETDRIMSEIDSGYYGPLPIVLARKALQYDALMAKVAARKAGKSEQTSAPPPATPVRTSGGTSKDPAQMDAREFAAWRKKQIANRR